MRRRDRRPRSYKPSPIVRNSGWHASHARIMPWYRPSTLPHPKPLRAFQIQAQELTPILQQDFRLVGAGQAIGQLRPRTALSSMVSLRLVPHRMSPESDRPEMAIRSGRNPPPLPARATRPIRGGHSGEAARLARSPSRTQACGIMEVVAHQDPCQRVTHSSPSTDSR